MLPDLEPYKCPPPLFPNARLVEAGSRFIVEAGGVAPAMALLFDRAGITIDVDGDPECLRSEHGQLLVGDHRNGLEALPLLALFGRMERPAMCFVAKPYSVQARLIAAFALKGEFDDVTIPVTPRALARERSSWPPSRHLFGRLMMHGNLLSASEIEALNKEALQKCADLVSGNDAVTLFPAGKVGDANKQSWRSGVGSVVHLLPKDKREEVRITPFRFGTFPRVGLVYALLKATRGLTSKPQTLRLRLGRQGTVTELLGAAVDSLTPEEITQTLQQQFQSALGSPN